MQRWECEDGPYLRWMKAAEKALGPRVWKSLANMDADSADQIMLALGVKPFPRSKFASETENRQVLVTHVTSDWLRPLPPGPDGPTVYKTPRPGVRGIEG